MSNYQRHSASSPAELIRDAQRTPLRFIASLLESSGFLHGWDDEGALRAEFSSSDCDAIEMLIEWDDFSGMLNLSCFGGITFSIEEKPGEISTFVNFLNNRTPMGSFCVMEVNEDGKLQTLCARYSLAVPFILRTEESVMLLMKAFLEPFLPEVRQAFTAFSSFVHQDFSFEDAVMFGFASISGNA